MDKKDKLKELYSQCLPFHNEQAQQRKKNWDNFFGVYSGKTRSKYFVPLTFSKVQGIVAKVLMSLYAYKDFFQTNPVTEEDEASALAMHKLLKRQVNTPNFFLNLSMWVTYSAIHSLSFVKTYWHREQKPYMVREPVYTKEGGFTGKFKKRIKKDWAIEEPRFSVCNMDNLIYHPQSPYLFPEYGDFIIDQYCLPVSGVLKKIKTQDWDSNISEQMLKESSAFLSEEWVGNLGYGDHYPSPFNPKYNIESDPMVLVTEYHKDEEYWVYANLTHQLHHEERLEYMQFKPYLSIKDYYVPHKVVGLSEPQIIADTQEYLNTTRNIRIDNLNIIQNRMWVVDIMADISREHLAVSKPGKVIYSANGTDAVKPLETQDINQSAYREEQIARADIDDVTGTGAPVMGQLPERSETASGIMQVIKQANPKFDLKGKIIGLVGLQRLLGIFGDYNSEYLEADQYIRMIGKDGVAFFDKIAPEEIPGRYQFEVISVSDYPVAEVRREQMTNWYRYAMNRPTVDQPYLDLMMAREFELTDHEISKLIKLPPTNKTMQQNVGDENQIMRYGGLVMVHPNDEDQAHLEGHKQYYQSAIGTLDMQKQELFETHMTEHFDAMKFKQQLNPAMAPGASAGMPPGGAMGGGGMPPGMGGEMTPSTSELPVSGEMVPNGAGQIMGQTL